MKYHRKMNWHKRFFAVSAVLVALVCVFVAWRRSDRNESIGADTSTRWTLLPDNRGIRWIPDAKLPHDDHIEMSGGKVSLVLRYKVDADGHYSDEKSLVFPCLRTIPNNTHASLNIRFATDIPSLISVDGRSLADGQLANEKVDSILINGKVKVCGSWTLSDSSAGNSGRASKKKTMRMSKKAVSMSRTIFPSTTLPAVYERVVVRNEGRKPVTLHVSEFSEITNTDASKGVDGTYVVRYDVSGAGTYALAAGESRTFDVIYQGYKLNEAALSPDVSAELAAREAFVSDSLDSSLVLETPDAIVDGMFRFAKIRAAESIYNTRSGPMHGPGGESYYAAIWANDQAEYINPFFPFLGYGLGNASAIHSFDLFAQYVNDSGDPLPSSIIAEGYDIWNGAGDRGDAAMIAYGASRFALANGDAAVARKLWPLIQWCLEYCRNNVNADGVVASDTDELENRFESGDANLCTSVLYYDALVSASYLVRELGLETSVLEDYSSRAKTMSAAIERYFGAEVSGYNTYRYYDGNTKLRSWICIPLIAGLDNRKSGTIAALTGPELMSENGCLTEQGSDVFWDRSTLYAFRGIFYSGETDLALGLLHDYSCKRLLGEHVPYAVEAWPEGSQRHLSAESGLYCRAITEGLFGIRPTGFRSFSMKVNLPSGWDHMALRHVRAFGSDFDVEVNRDDNGGVSVTVITAGGSRVYSPVNGTVEVRL